MKVKKEGLVKIIAREYPYYNNEQISEMIEEYGSEYFNGNGCRFRFKYLGFGEWLVSREEGA